MAQRAQYIGRVVYSGENQAGNLKFNWRALVVWLLSLPISLVPVYIALVQHLDQTNGTITDDFWLACFKQYDVLWVFATILLFSCMNHFAIRRRQGRSKGFITALRVLGGFLFVFLELTWLSFKYLLTHYQPWVGCLGTTLIIVAMIIATPLQVNFIKSEG